MTPNQVRNDIQNACDILADKGISLLNQPIFIERDNNIVQITWRQTSITNAKPCHFATIEQYLSILEDGSFTCVLLDGSLLRLSYTFNRAKLVAHNLWYYPCPFDIPREELLVYPLIDILEIYADGNIDKWRMKSPIRFDFDIKRAVPILHPCSHVHFQDVNSRIPAQRPLSPGNFFNFIFKNFYYELVRQYSFLLEWPEDTYDKTMFENEERYIHFAWR